MERYERGMVEGWEEGYMIFRVDWSDISGYSLRQRGGGVNSAFELLELVLGFIFLHHTLLQSCLYPSRTYSTF